MLRVNAYLETNNDVMTVEYLSKGSPKFSAVEECWRQGKDDLLVSKYYPSFTNLKAVIADYYIFNLNMSKYYIIESLRIYVSGLRIKDTRSAIINI